MKTQRNFVIIKKLNNKQFIHTNLASCIPKLQEAALFWVKISKVFNMEIKMEWIEYELKFAEIAKKHNKSQKYCKRWMEYAKKLWDRGLPIIFTQNHLCALLGYQPVYVYAVSNAPCNFYHYYKVQKKNGGTRNISEPLPNLKEIQRWILENILYRFEISPYAKAYVKNRSIKDNVRFHRRQRKVLSLDVKDFFGHLTDWMVYQLFIESGYSESVAMMLTNLCCLEGSLPQGAPTSAALSNILMKDFDYKIGDFCKMFKIRFTRYADDMTFSGDFDETKVISFVKKNLRDMQLTINDAKTRVRKQGQQQEVTGIVVNYKPQLARSIRKDIRKDVYYIKKYGLQSHLQYIQEERSHYLEHLFGLINYALFINSDDKEMKRYKMDIKYLMSNEK